MLELIERRGPDLVALSGDLTQRAKPAQFRQARQFVDRIPVPVLAVPGNHDVPLYRVWERLARPLGAYRANFSPDLEPVHRQPDLLAIGVNTAHGLTFTGGWWRARRLREIGELLAEAPAAAYKIVVAHHHLVPPRRFDLQSVSRNAHAAIELFSSAGVDLVLSGHHHQSYIGSSEEYYPRGRHPVVLAHSGTTTSSRGRASETGANSCNWIELAADRFVVENLRWTPALDRFTVASRHLYPRATLEPGGLDNP